MKAKRSRREAASSVGAVVVGARGGIGAAVCAELARRGARVLEADRTVRRSARGAVHVDVRDDRSVRALRAEALRQLGRVEVLINCAGVLRARSILFATPDDWTSSFEVNVVGAARLTRAFAEAMARTGGGRILHLSSVAGLRGLPGAAPYAASKGALLALCATAAVELASWGVQVAAVAPGLVRTGMLKPLGNAALAGLRVVGARNILEPGEVAQRLVRLALGETSWPADGLALLDGEAVR